MERSHLNVLSYNSAEVARSLQQDIGQLLIGGFPGPGIDPVFARMARNGTVGGAILFRRNLEDIESVRAMNNELHALRSEEPLMVALDQEGGRVQRLRSPFPELPPMRVFGQIGDAELAREAGRVLGTSLRVLGFDQNYAPVLDVDSNPANPVIGDRSFSSDARIVCRLGAAFIDGIQASGVAACGKHFPGHGDTDLDSHLDLPRLNHDHERLRLVELPPFRAATKAGVAAIMSAHVVFAGLDPRRPATLSPLVIRPILREEIGFEGVIVSDDLEMRAISDNYDVGRAAVEAIAAGCDQLLICHHPEQIQHAFDCIERAVLDKVLAEELVRTAADRVLRMKRTYVQIKSETNDADIGFPHDAHAELVARLGDTATAKVGSDPTERTT